MAAPRFILSSEALQQAPVCLTGADARHARVLRLQSGDEVRLCDGQGREWSARIAGVTPQALALGELTPLAAQPEPALQVTLYQGLARGDKLELIVQKGTELGMTRLVPMVTAHSQLRLEAASPKRIRWQEIARQAARQCGRTRVPEVAAPLSFAQALTEGLSAEVAIMPFERAGAEHSWKRQLASKAQVNTVSLFIGPEGGFSDQEMDLALAAGVQGVSLGPRILRSETAGLITVALALFQWGDLGGGA
ncbi:MAG: 16S rRNA (uracil(1498)-N(3))-methyltransferase [Candidatus Firestonebacteria bacterium]|nr:16S rRNA (uracil(1498)-N(3))-methyltransferase [Candidatus Firestonebacteria bacterium]